MRQISQMVAHYTAQAPESVSNDLKTKMAEDLMVKQSSAGHRALPLNDAQPNVKPLLSAVQLGQEVS
jgi:hypothetical protein